MFHMHSEFEGGILFPEYDRGQWTPFWNTAPKTEKIEVDGKLVEYEITDYVRVDDAERSELAEVLKAIKGVNQAFSDR